MTSRVTVIAGPARSGKTHALLKDYRNMLRGQRGAAATGTAPIGGTLWIGPNRRAVEQVRDALLADGLTGCFDPGIQTFDQFARRVTSHAASEVRPIDDRSKRLLLEQLLREALAAGKLKHFAAIAHTSGFLDLTARFISELKRVEIWPEQFEDACKRAADFAQRGKPAQRERELIELYKSYQDILEKHQLYDAEGLFWSARSLLQAGQRAPYDGLKLVVVDGFTDFTRTQLEILDELARRSEQLVISLTDEESNEREDLFAKPRRTLAQLRERHAGLEVRRLPRRPEAEWPALAHVERELFKSPRRMQSAESHERIEFIAASGTVAEVEELARRVKRLIVVGDDSATPLRRVRPEEITIVCRSLTDNGSLLREFFTRYGIPTALESGRPLGQSPSLTALMALVKLGHDDWPFRDLLAVLGGNYFRPNWQETASPGVPEATERTIRRMQVPSGRDVLLETIDKVAHRAPDVVDPRDPFSERSERRNRERADALLALPVLKRLATALDALPSQASAAEWSEALKELARETGILQSMSDAKSDQLHSQPLRDLGDDFAAWNSFHQALGAGDRLAQLTRGAPAMISRSDLVDYLETIVQTEQLPGERDENGRVRILSAITARTLAAPYLFVAGLSEKAFPANDGGGQIYSDAEIQQLVGCGLPLTSASQRRRDEMLLFYETILRAERRLWLSFPALNEKAEPLLPSPYLAELARICKHDLHKHDELSDLSPVAPDGVLLNIFDARIRAAANAGRPDGDGAELAAVVRHSAETGRNLLAGLAIVDERSRRGAFGGYEGMILGDDARRMLEKRFAADFPWSAGQLEQYGGCPYQFFLQRVLRLQPVGEVGLEIDYGKRGSRVHDVLAELHAQMNERLGRYALPSETAPADYEQIVEEAISTFLRKDPDESLLEAFRAVDEKLLRRWLLNYAEQHGAYEKTNVKCDELPRPRHFEASFGMPNPPADKISTSEPLELVLHEERVKITGRIDRIDVGMSAGRAVFTIVDYKTGSSAGYSKSHVISGQALQLTLYAMATERLLLRGDGAVPWQFGYWFVADSGFKKTLLLHEVDSGDLKPTGDWTELRERIVERVVSLVRGIRRGEFPMYNEDEDCTSRCDFRTVCRVSQVRSLEKAWQPPSPQR